MQELRAKYIKQKNIFLDSLQPDDLRNGESFNQLEMIIDKINEGCYRAALNKENSQQFIEKAAANLFRENSSAAKKAIELSKIYLEMKLGYSSFL